MDKTTHSSSEDSTSTNANNNNNNNNRDQYLRHLNKISHRISKPLRRPTFDHPLPPPPPPPTASLHAPPHNLQPPVYNINKSDFRDVVQKLTGSPAPERFSSPPPPIHPPKPQSSRLHRIRPPPLAGVTNRPAVAASVNGNPNCTASAAAPFPDGNFVPAFRQVSPASPLPPFPSVHGAAESPISAYMRYLQGGDSEPKNFPRPPISPRWNTSAPPPHLPPQPQPPATAPLQFPAMPSSPLPFGCLPSPRSPYPMPSPGMLFSPGFPQLPVSPRVPVTSPRWRDL